MTYYWLIEVVYTPGEGCSPRYFDGRYEPNWEGNTTLDPYKAQRYALKELAEADIARLAPRELGEWRAVEHRFE